MQSVRNWLFSKKADLLLLFLPVWLTWGFCFVAPQSWLSAAIPIWVFVVFVLGIDVSHVWSTIFRTYLDREEFRRHRSLLLYSPLVCFTICFLIAAISQLWFWRILTYVAIFHFVRQQFGFMRLYATRRRESSTFKYLNDSWMIYFSMLYPIVYWHLISDRYFSWFVDGGFLTFELFSIDRQSVQWILDHLGNSFYWLLFLCWFIEEVVIHKRTGIAMPWGKIAWMLTTAFNWYLGIVYFNSDLAFTVTNVVAHGIPYIVLVLFYVERKKVIKQPSRFSSNDQFTRNFWIRSAGMITLILVFATFEEFLWDMLLYRDYSKFFETILKYPIAVLDNSITQALALALHSVPQATHYIVDGFIWKRSQKNPDLKAILS